MAVERHQRATELLGPSPGVAEASLAVLCVVVLGSGVRACRAQAPRNRGRGRRRGAATRVARRCPRCRRPATSADLRRSPGRGRSVVPLRTAPAVTPCLWMGAQGSLAGWTWGTRTPGSPKAEGRCPRGLPPRLSQASPRPRGRGRSEVLHRLEDAASRPARRRTHDANSAEWPQLGPNCSPCLAGLDAGLNLRGGGPGGTRTPDFHTASVALSQLSYRPTSTVEEVAPSVGRAESLGPLRSTAADGSCRHPRNVARRPVGAPGTRDSSGVAPIGPLKRRPLASSVVPRPP